MERIGLSLSAFLIAYLLDLLIGDPRRFPHPVRFLGAFIDWLEEISRRLFVSTAGLKIAGILIVLIAGGGSVLVTVLFIASAYRLHLFAGWIVETYILFTVLAGGDLYKHVAGVMSELAAGRLQGARTNLAMLVSRDVEKLSAAGIARATLESLFENTADGLVAPLFYAAIGGAPLAVFYKAINTLDSMLGYQTDEYINIGYFSAKADDILSYIPSRLTAFLLVLAGAAKGAARPGMRILASDRSKHNSPNSAWPEAAAAGVLGIRFGGPDCYQGRLVSRPLINAAGRDAGHTDIERGLILFRQVSMLSFIFFLGIHFLLLSRGVGFY